MKDESERGLVPSTNVFNQVRGFSPPVWVKFLLPVVIVLLAVLVMYGYFLIPPHYPKIFGTFDYCRYFGPQAYFMDCTVHDGAFPLWNPLAFCGMPFAASPQQTAFYPPHLLRSLLTVHPTPFRTHVGLALLMVFHMVLAGAGTFALAREYRLSRGAGLVAAFAFIFGPHFVRRVMEQWILVAVVAWFPLLLLLVRRAMRARAMSGKIYYASAAALVFGVSTLAGFPQLTFYSVIAMGLFCLLERLFEHAAHVWSVRHGSVHRKKPAHRRCSRLFLTDGMILGIVFVLGTAVAMAMLLPASELVRSSARVRSSGLEVNAAAQDLSPKHLLQSMVAYEGATFSEQGCRAAGLGVLFLAFMAVAHRRRRDVALYGVLFVVLTDCTLGPPFPVGLIVRLLDVFQFSSPWRAGILAGFPLAMLAGFGVDAAVRELRSRRWNILRSSFIMVAGLLAWYVLLQWFRHDLPVLNQTRAYFGLTPLVLAAPLLTLAVMVASGWLPFPRFWRALIPVLVFTEMFLWNMTYFPAFIAKSGYKDSPDRVAGAGQLLQGNTRWADPGPNTFFYTLKPAMNGYDPVCLSKVRSVLCAPSRETKYLRTLKDWEVTSENQRGNLFLKRPFWLARQYVKGPLPPKDALFPPTTTVFLQEAPALAMPEVASSTVPVHGTSEHTERIPLADAPLLASLTSRGGVSIRCALPPIAMHKRHAVLCVQYTARGAADVGTTFQEVSSGNKAFGKHYTISAGTTGVLEYPLPDFNAIQATLTWKAARGDHALELQEAYVLHDLEDEDGLITIESCRANSVDLVLNNLPDRRLLLFTDAMFPGWRAFIDGTETPIYTANDVFKAIAVPPGTHKVRFAFSSWRVVLGVAVSLAAVGGIVAGLLIGRRGSRKPQPMAPRGISADHVA